MSCQLWVSAMTTRGMIQLSSPRPCCATAVCVASGAYPAAEGCPVPESPQSCALHPGGLGRPSAVACSPNEDRDDDTALLYKVVDKNRPTCVCVCSAASLYYAVQATG